MKSRTQRAPKTAVALLGFIASLALVACGGGDSVGGGNDAKITTAQAGEPHGEMSLSTWVGYIDKGDNGTINEFEAKYPGTTIDYNEDVNDNNSFFGKVQPQLDKGESGGRSMFVVTDWMAKQMYDLGYLQEIDYADVPTVDANLIDSLRSPSFDPERKFSIPWQTGMTGLLVNKRLAPDIASVNDLFDPKYKGKVTVLTEMRDTVPLLLKADGIDPTDATTEQWKDEIGRLKDAVDSGQLRRFTGNDYVQDLDSENVVASIGWSGDENLIANEDVEWRMPTEGCILWSDNMVIPVGAPNPETALAWADFAYRPEVQADIAAYVHYVTPVDGVKEVLQERDPALADDQLIFPTDQFTADCTTQPNPPGDQAAVNEVTQAFQDVVND